MMSINRIRLEFKGSSSASASGSASGINRIRLEFKGVTDDTLFMQYPY